MMECGRTPRIGQLPLRFDQYSSIGNQERNRMSKRDIWRGVCVTAVAAGAVLAGHFALAGTKVQVGKPCNQAERPSLADVDHGSLDALLRKYVDDRGLVAYAQWKA